MEIDGEQLIIAIAQNKTQDRKLAEKAFELFCGHYEEKAIKMAIVICRNYKRPESYAYDIVQCAFQKIWLYPTFKKNKTRINNTDRAILQWISKILYHELTLFSEKGDCSHPEAEDLPLITSSEAFVENFYGEEHISNDEMMAVKEILDKILFGLSEQEVTIFLTYKLYLKEGKSVPRNVLKKLRHRYNLSQDSIKHCRLRVEQKIASHTI